MVPFLLACIAAAGFIGASLLVETAMGTSRRFHHLSVVIAAGILLGIAFADLIPESLELVSTTRAALSIASGFLVLFLVETFTGGHTHHHEPHVHGHGQGAASAHAHSHAPVDDDGCVPQHAVAPFLIGLGIHNFADGIAIGATDHVSDSASAGVATGILIHQLPVGLSFAAVLVASGVAMSRARRDALFIGLLIPVGTLVVLAVPDLGTATLGSLIGFAAGALIYIASGHLLPEAQSEHRHPLIASSFAIALVATILLVHVNGH